jgi:hypothetical protein
MDIESRDLRLAKPQAGDYGIKAAKGGRFEGLKR